jgi:membrane-bound serine protease (ClpP class)
MMRMIKAMGVAALLLLGPGIAFAQNTDVAVVLRLDGVVSPATADYVVRGIRRAEAEHAQLVVLQMDTPGGLDTSMREIIKAILGSSVPVASFVAPTGARAASAGTYIMYASHVAAMAPATNLGAASPIAMGIGGTENRKPEDTLARKQMQDAAAYIRSLAQLRGRNAEWAERAVREAVSLSAEEALQQHVIDLVANDVPDLLKKLDGRKVNVAGVDRILHTANMRIQPMEPDWRSRFLAVITDPSIAYILMLLGVYGLFFEFANPGFVLPGVAGAICLLLGLFALQLLPVNYAGLGLILLGLGLMVAEAFVPSFGTLGIGGVIAFVFGSVMLMNTDVPGYGIPWAVIIPVAATSALFLFLVAGMAIKARKRPVVSGREEMLGSIGEVLEDMEHQGVARVHSEIWTVRSKVPLHRGQRVKVTGMQGLVLEVVPDTGKYT